ncbi:hypothetical protein [Floridanema evergladense]|uniref:Uncharacterized protein n=1 Tax=Floridaenema evergladense BLCC-F167 TaxID=3153639 RepID=A0ABV4WHQ1_9CYAN
MLHIFSTLQNALHKVLISTLIVLLSLSILVLPAQNSLAAAPTYRQPMQTEVGNSQESETAREKAYDKEINVLNEPNGLEEEYKENLEVYEETQPDKGIIQEAKSFVEKVTGQD